MIGDMSSPKKLVRKVVKGKALRGIEQGFRKGRGVAWQTRYGFPAKGMRVVAVTGTNGKTTTCSYIGEVLKAGGYKVAVYTTAYFEIAGKREANRTHMTVAGQADVQKFFARAKRENCDFVVLEVTSMALDQHRIDGIPIEVAVMTNLTQDHLDYHKTMERYAEAKAILFGAKIAPKYSILNVDDSWFGYFKDRATGELITYGQSDEATVELKCHENSEDGSDFDLEIRDMKAKMSTKLVGTFNIYNALAAVSVGYVIGMKLDHIAEGVKNLQTVPGRMESIDVGQDFKVLVDFAITPDALLNALTALQVISIGQVRIVFGATGDRDKDKRPLMGEVVAEHADQIYLTDDETYSEDPKTIRDAVYEGIKRKGGAGKTQVFNDRLDAIKQAFADAEEGDIVLLTGLGHEDYRNMGGQKLLWDEREVARNLLQEL